MPSSFFRNCWAIGYIPTPWQLNSLRQADAGRLHKLHRAINDGLLKRSSSGFQPEGLSDIEAGTVEGAINLKSSAEFARPSRHSLRSLSLFFVNPGGQAIEI